MFRGSYNTSFRVPTFNQIFNGVTISPYAGSDIVDPTGRKFYPVGANVGINARIGFSVSGSATQHAADAAASAPRAVGA